MPYRVFGQVALVTALALLLYYSVKEYNTDNLMHNNDSVTVISSHRRTQTAPTNIEVKKNTVAAKQSSVSNYAFSHSKNISEIKLLHSIPNIDKFDVDSDQSVVSCKNGSCSAHLFYRKDITNLAINAFMEEMQSSATSQSLYRNGFLVEGMTFGQSVKDKTNYFELYVRDIN